MTDYIRRLEEELVRAGYDRRLSRRIRRAAPLPVIGALATLPVVALMGVALAVGAGGDDTAERTAAPTHEARRTTTSDTAVDVEVRPTRGRRNTAFTVTITPPRATGRSGQRRRLYLADVHAVTPRGACVNNRDGVFPTGPAGVRVRLRLSPLGTEGGNLGWCRSRFRGTVTWQSAYACPDEGACHPPADVPLRREVVGHFSFRVR